MEKSKIIEELFAHIVTYSYLLLPLLFLFKKQKTRDTVLLAIYGIVFFLLLFFYDELKRDKKLYQAVYTFLEYASFALLYYFNIENKKYKRVIIYLSLFFVAFLVAFNLYTNKTRVDSIPIGVESILIFVYIFLFFIEKLNKPEVGFIYSHHCFWISVGLLVYLGGSFFINILANEFSTEEFEKYWYLNFIADTVKTILFAISILFITNKSLSKQNQKSSSVPYLDMI